MKNTNRTKGHNAERHYASKLKEVFPDCLTSRYASKALDDAGVDLANIPILVQIKAGIQKGMKPDEILKNIENKIPKMMSDFPKVLIHHKQGKPGKKRDEYSSLVTMTFDDFFTIIKLAYDIQNK